MQLWCRSIGLYGVTVAELSLGNKTAAQDAAHHVILRATVQLHGRLATAAIACGDGGWGYFEQGALGARLDLCASAVSVPDCAATCNPGKLIKTDLRKRIVDASTIFPDPPAGLANFPGFHSGPRAEYILLTVS